MLLKVIILGCVIALASGKKLGKCAESRVTAFDKCASDIFIGGNPNNTFPQNIEDANEWCRKGKSAVRCIKKFTKDCLEGLPKQVNGLLAYGVNKFQRKACKNAKSRTEFFTKLSCCHKDKEGINGEFYKFIDNAQLITNAESAQVFPLVCCTFFNFLKTSSVVVGGVCPPPGVQYYQNFVTAVAADVLELLCTGYNPAHPACLNPQYPPKGEGITKRPLTVMGPVLLSVDNL